MYRTNTGSRSSCGWMHPYTVLVFTLRVPAHGAYCSRFMGSPDSAETNHLRSLAPELEAKPRFQLCKRHGALDCATARREGTPGAALRTSGRPHPGALRVVRAGHVPPIQFWPAHDVALRSINFRAALAGVVSIWLTSPTPPDLHVFRGNSRPCETAECKTWN